MGDVWFRSIEIDVRDEVADLAGFGMIDKSAV